MISKDDIEAFRDNVATKDKSSFGDHVFCYEESDNAGNLNMSFSIRKLDKFPGYLYLSVKDEQFGDIISIMIPAHVAKEMIKAMERTF